MDIFIRSDIVLIVMMGLLTWQTCTTLGYTKGRLLWLCGSLILALGLEIESIPPEMFDQTLSELIGFHLITLGLGIGALALRYHCGKGLRSTLYSFGLLLIIIQASVFLPNAQMLYGVRGLVMAFVFAWYIVTFFSIYGRWTPAILGIPILLFAIASALFLGRTINAFSQLSLPKGSVWSEAPWLSNLVYAFASAAVISSGIAFLAILALKQARFLMGQAHKDPLTGAYNRRALNQRLEELQGSNSLRTFSVIMLDIDHFKSVNDTLGHAAGDTVLKNLVLHLQKSIREKDFLARYGGEEFTLVLMDLDKTAAFAVIERIRKGFNQTTLDFPNNQVRTLSFSAGISDTTEGVSGQHLLQLADQRLYTAKNNGRNTVCRD